MWINITKEIFEKSEFKSLNFLYQILSWYPSDSCLRYNIVVDTRNVINTKNFVQLSSVEKNLKEFLDIEYVNFTNTHSNISHKIAYKKKENNFNIEEAILFFNQPISIILENNKNDAQFIVSIINHFGFESGSNKSLEHLNNGWIEFENAGGCSNIPNFTEAFLNKFKKIAKKNNRNKSDYFRGVIIIDSDKEFENQISKQNSVIEKLKLLGLDKNVHVLEKRMMENYLPKEVFLEIKRQDSVKNNSSLKDWLDAYLNLEQKEQLDFINIYEGNLQGNTNPTPNELTVLWSDLGNNFQKLNSGFKFQGFKNDGNLKSSKESSFKNEMPDWFKKSFISKQNLEERDGKGELQDIQDKINKLL